MCLALNKCSINVNCFYPEAIYLPSSFLCKTAQPLAGWVTLGRSTHLSLDTQGVCVDDSEGQLRRLKNHHY